MRSFCPAIRRLAIVALGLTWPGAVAVAAKPPPTDNIIADFNSGRKPNNLGGDFGCWISDPADSAQGCIEAFDRGALRVIYSVDSDKPAFGGIWMRLQNLDATQYDRLVLRVRGDAGMGFTATFKVELKDAMDQSSSTYVRGITDQWQDISIPLGDFQGMANRKKLKEFVIVIEDRTATAKRGMFYIDEIRLAKPTA